ncbi:anhydro-N-acetylmuramic acid kinase, partial [Staphylococcus aureus]|nr:anhydro-N-acetylmuramic acid kinase [Staphylococcus aureus]
MLAIGLMSGTSLDGVDAALIETDGEAQVRA